MVILALRVDGDGAALRIVERIERVGVGRVAHAEYDDGADFGPQARRAAAAIGVRRHPLHVAVTSGVEERGKTVAGIPDRVRRRHAHRIEAERRGFAQQHVLERRRHGRAVRNRGRHNAPMEARRARGRPIWCGTRAAT